MLVTKHAAELCALLVNDFYGELPSRVFHALLIKGRSNIAQLIRHTSLSSRHLRNGLGVLFQQNLLYTRTDPDSKVTTYEANPDACYNLVRSGKILEVIETKFGHSERDLVQTLLLLGHARIHDLTEAFASRAPRQNGHTNGAHRASAGVIESGAHFKFVLARLIQAGIIDTVRGDTFRNPEDEYHDISQDVTKAAPGERTTSKNKDENERLIAERYRVFRDRGQELKHWLERNQGFGAKRRKLANGKVAQNGDYDEDDVPDFNPSKIVKVNHEKCLVELRNQRLAEFATDTFGEATGAVYRSLLELLTTRTPRCRKDSKLLGQEDDEAPLPVTTLDIYDHLDENVNVNSGIGKASANKINQRSAERIKTNVPQPDDESEDSDDGGTSRPQRFNNNHVTENNDDSHTEHSDEDDELGNTAQSHRRSATNGERSSRVTFDDEPPPTGSRIDQMRQHLLLLKESSHRFVRHCGTMGRGQWTVDFDQVLMRLQEIELDSVIEHSFGRSGLRLTRILREKGKLDEKMLHSVALMKKGDVQGKMLAMQMAGLVDIQEVPKDNSRLANRTLFFWFFDGERSQTQLLDDIYKAMVRCMQTLQVERHKERNILSFVGRKDVQGKEEEVMTAEHYNKYNNHLEVQEKLLGQVIRLDGVVSVFRDF